MRTLLLGCSLALAACAAIGVNRPPLPVAAAVGDQPNTKLYKVKDFVVEVPADWKPDVTPLRFLAVAQGTCAEKKFYGRTFTSTGDWQDFRSGNCPALIVADEEVEAEYQCKNDLDWMRHGGFSWASEVKEEKVTLAGQPAVLFSGHDGLGSERESFWVWVICGKKDVYRLAVAGPTADPRTEHVRERAAATAQFYGMN